MKKIHSPPPPLPYKSGLPKTQIQQVHSCSTRVGDILLLYTYNRTHLLRKAFLVKGLDFHLFTTVKVFIVTSPWLKLIKLTEQSWTGKYKVSFGQKIFLLIIIK